MPYRHRVIAFGSQPTGQRKPAGPLAYHSYRGRNIWHVRTGGVGIVSPYYILRALRVLVCEMLIGQSGAFVVMFAPRCLFS